MEIPSYFSRYLRAIQPTIASRELAIQLHQTLTCRLGEDAYFQDWYDRTFLYGSYRRNTAIQPIKDVDICVLLKLDTSEHTPESVINRLRRVLERSGYDAKTALQRRSVRIDMSQTTLDIVPVVAINGIDEPLLIPDRPLERWVETHPKGHLKVASEINKDCNKRYIPFVKIVKAWYRYQAHNLKRIERPKPKGFTLEALVAKYQDRDAPSYAEAFTNFLANLWSDCGSSLEMGIFPGVPDPGLPGTSLKLNIDAEEAKIFASIVKNSLEQAQLALANPDISESVYLWHSVFGPKFPATPDTTVTKSFSTTEDDDLDSEVSDEIADTELVRVTQPAALKLSVGIAREEGGTIIGWYRNDGWPLAKNVHLQFSITQCSVLPPYKIHWIVENHGSEAKKANQLTHATVTEQGIQWEHTAYRGSHTMRCEVRRDDVILASTNYKVNIR